MLALDGPARAWEPKRLRLRIVATWPWAAISPPRSPVCRPSHPADQHQTTPTTRKAKPRGRPHPGAVHRRNAAGDLGGRQGDRDAARGAAPGHRQGRRRPGEDADPAGGRGETQPQTDGHFDVRLRHRACPPAAARRDRPARRPHRPPHPSPQAESDREMAGRISGARPRRHDHRRVRRGRRPRPAAPADLGGPGRRRRAPARPDPRRSRRTRRHHPHRH
jgi:hypothetical protein